MSDIVACFRSDRPEVLAAWNAYKDAHIQFSQNVEALTAELWPNPIEGHNPEPMVRTGTAWDPGRKELAGWSWRRKLPVPEGWKYDRQQGVLTPKVSTKVGKALKKRMDEAVPEVKALSLPGMPSHEISYLPHINAPGVEQHGGCMFVCWGCEPKKVDENIWTRIKVSEFYAARENDPDYEKAPA